MVPLSEGPLSEGPLSKWLLYFKLPEHSLPLRGIKLALGPLDCLAHCSTAATRDGLNNPSPDSPLLTSVTSSRRYRAPCDEEESATPRDMPDVTLTPLRSKSASGSLKVATQNEAHQKEN